MQDNNTFFGCIKYASNLPVLIVSVKLNASLKKDLEKAEKSVKESVSEIRLDIFESCHNGEITEEERDTLLKLI